MTANEIARAYREMDFEEEHHIDVLVELQKKDLIEEVAKELSLEYLRQS